MRHSRIAKLGLPCLLVAVIVAVANGCSSGDEPISAPGSGGAPASDASAGSGATSDSGAGGSGAAGGSEAGRADAPADVEWDATCGAAVPSGAEACFWACGCQQCARVAAECLANNACKAIIECALQTDCTNDPGAGANACQVKCASVITANFTAGGLRAAAMDQCATSACRTTCAADGASADADAPADTGPDAPADVTPKDAPADVTTKDSPPDGTAIDVRADEPPIDAPADISVQDAPADGVEIDSSAQADADGAADAGGRDASAD